MKTLHKMALGLLITLAVIALPTVIFAQDGGNYSGDDAYDPAAGALIASNARFVMNFSGDDAYDLAAGGEPAKTPMRYVNCFSGDDAYDPAAGGLYYYEPTVRYLATFSGDDAYDPAGFFFEPPAQDVFDVSASVGGD